MNSNNIQTVLLLARMNALKNQQTHGLQRSADREESNQPVLLGKRALPVIAGFEAGINEAVKNGFKRCASDNFISQKHHQNGF